MSSVAPGITAEEVEKYRFDSFELYPKQRALWRDGVRVALMPKPLDTLLLLVERAGQTVSKEDLFAQIWNGAAVEENNLTQSISTVRKALGERRGENRYIVTDSGRGYRFVAVVSRVMEPAPVITDGARVDEPVPVATTPRRWNRGTLAMAAALVVLLAAIGSWLITHRGVHSPLRRSVAVLRIRDLSKTSTEAWLQTALTEMLTSELSAGGKLRTIPAADVARWRADLGAADDDARQADLLRSAQKNLGADTLVLGSYVVTGTCPGCRVRVDLGLSNAHTGEHFGTIIEEGSATDLLDLTTRLGRRLRAELGINADLAASPRWPAASAMREYAEGLKALRLTDPVAARDHLQTAVATDPGNALIHSALADAWTALGYSTRANEENRRAYELSGSLDRLDQVGIEARYRASLQQWDRAIEIYKTIFQLFPDSLDDGLNLARAQMRGMHAAEVSSSLRILRGLPAPAGNDPRIDLLEAEAVGVTNNYPRTRELAHRAAEEAKTRGARYLYARARLLEGGALQTMADLKYAAVQDEARHVCEQIGDRDCVSKAWRMRGNERYFFGDFPGAQAAYSQGTAIARELGNRGELANLLVGFGVVAKANRDWAQAEQHLLEAISLRIETGYNPSEVQSVLAELYIDTGRLSEAGRVIEAALTAAQQAGAQQDLGEILGLQSILARSRGELDRAQQLSDRAVAELRRTKGQAALRVALAESSSLATTRGDLQTAGKNLTEAGTGVVPEIEGALQLARAELWIAQGRFQDAVSEAERSSVAFDKAHADDRSARAFVIEADALEMLHQDGKALEACHEGARRAALIPNPLPLALARLCEWRLAGVPGEAPAPDLDNPELALASDYARAMRARRSASGNSRLRFKALARSATARGYFTLARRAQSLAQAAQ